MLEICKINVSKNAHKNIFKKILYLLCFWMSVVCAVVCRVSVWSTGSVLWRTDVSLAVAPGSAVGRLSRSAVGLVAPLHMGI